MTIEPITGCFSAGAKGLGIALAGAARAVVGCAKSLGILDVDELRFSHYLAAKQNNDIKYRL